jgi:hypothetical protein
MRRVSLIALAALAGCGNEAQRPPQVVAPDPARGERVIRLDEAGVRFTGPFNWRDLVVGQTGAVGGVQSNRGALAVWRYERGEPLPDDEEALEEVRDLLVERVEARDPSFELAGSELTRLGGALAIVLRGRQTIAGIEVEVRSAHVFREGAEIVLDCYAPPPDFERIDRTVCRKALRTLRLRDPRKPKATPTPSPTPTPPPA